MRLFCGCFVIGEFLIKILKMTNVFVEISLQINSADRPTFKTIYKKYRTLFMESVVGGKSKELLIREEDAQVLLGFDTFENATNYLTSKLFTNDVVGELKPLLQASPDVRIYSISK